MTRDVGRSESLKLNLGCGLDAADGWVNVDNSLNARLAQHPNLRWLAYRVGLLSEATYTVPWSTGLRILDVRRGLPFRDGEVACVYTSMLITEMSLAEARELFADVFRVLQPNGIFRIVTIDMEKMARQYIARLECADVETEDDQLPASVFMRRVGFGIKTPVGFVERLIKRPAHRGLRQWVYDERSLKFYLAQCGFECERREYRDSAIHDVAAVERHEFKSAFCLECRKSARSRLAG